MVSETSQSQKDKYYMILSIWGIQSSQIYRKRKWNGGCQGLGGGNGSYYLMGHRALQDEKILETDYTTIWIWT